MSLSNSISVESVAVIYVSHLDPSRQKVTIRPFPGDAGEVYSLSIRELISWFKGPAACLTTARFLADKSVVRINPESGQYSYDRSFQEVPYHTLMERLESEVLANRSRDQ